MARASVRIKRGLAANIPAIAPLGELHLAVDTGELWFGTGSGMARSPKKQTRGWVTTINQEQTFTFPEAFAAPPVVVALPISNADDRINTVEMVGSPTANSVTLRCWVGQGLLASRETTSLTVHIIAYGQLA